MAEKTEISWAHSTFNPWLGCTKVSPGCDHCYAAELMDHRYGRVKWGAGEARQRTKTWDQPRRWNRLAAASGKPWRVFCASLADVFDNEVNPAWRDDLFDLIDETPALTWMILTKRIGNVRIDYTNKNATSLRPNIWLGITVVNQEEATRDIPKLLAVPAAVRFLSLEPMIGPIDLQWYLTPNVWESGVAVRGRDYGHGKRVDWVIVGGESGRQARPMDPTWARQIRDQCAEAGVPFFFKQWGGRTPKSNGHLLDGQEYHEFPNRSPKRKG